MFHRIANISPADGLTLIVEFVTGERKKYHIEPLFNRWEQFKALSSAELFNSVKVDTGGYGIVWDDELDLSSDELWENGTPIQ